MSSSAVAVLRLLYRGGILMAEVGDFILQRLSEWGVKRIFGYPGDGING